MSRLKAYDELDEWSEQKKIHRLEGKQLSKILNESNGRNTFYSNKEVDECSKPSSAFVHENTSDDTKNSKFTEIKKEYLNAIKANKKYKDKLEKITTKCNELEAQIKAKWDANNRIANLQKEGVEQTKKIRNHKYISQVKNFFYIPKIEKIGIKTKLLSSRKQMATNQLDELQAILDELCSKSIKIKAKVSQFKSIIKKHKFALYQAMHTLLEKGTNNRKGPITWLIREIWALEFKLCESRFPKILDKQSIEYLFNLASREAEIEAKKHDKEKLLQGKAPIIANKSEIKPIFEENNKVIVNALHCSCQTTNQLTLINNVQLNNRDISESLVQSFNPIHQIINDGSESKELLMVSQIDKKINQLAHQMKNIKGNEKIRVDTLYKHSDKYTQMCSLLFGNAKQF